jgi:hypothetical protein
MDVGSYVRCTFTDMVQLFVVCNTFQKRVGYCVLMLFAFYWHFAYMISFHYVPQMQCSSDLLKETIFSYRNLV